MSLSKLRQKHKMSSSEETEPDVLGSATAMSRRLQTFGSPDLAVTVGVDEHLYKYHSLILASQSLYVDTLLSSPAARTEQEKRRISFPDITRETWEKMMKYLFPTNTMPSVDDLVEIIPFYDKYQFLDGMAYCDEILAELYVGSYDGYGYREHHMDLAWLTAYIYDLLPDFFPKSRPLAIKWGKKFLSRLWGDDEEMIKTLLPLIENDNETTRAMVSTFLGRKCVGMTMNEMRDLVKQTDFPEQCIVRNSQISMLDEQRQKLQIAYLDVCGASDLVSGKYDERSCHHERHVYAGNHCGGAMGYIWEKKDTRLMDDGASVTVKVGAIDCYGSAWEIYSFTQTDDDEETELSKKVLYRWENGIFTSLVPPKYGWEKAEDDETFVKSKMCLSYSFGKPYY